MKKAIGTVVLIAFALAGCSTVSEKTTPGGLCTGTKRPYQVNGAWYNPQEHYEYKETGVASWYGPRFHGRPKSCGEIFNMHGMSAAHKTLPIPSVVRVTNVQNGKSVNLLVDDRGPFVGDRIIDLSKGAAAYLGFCSQGLGKVEVECLPEESKAFAKFVAQYGRYGRDPNGRSWEVIFRQQFNQNDSVPHPKSLKYTKSYHSQKSQKWPRIMPKKQQPFQSPLAKPIPVVKHSSKARKGTASEEKIDQEIEAFLNETRSYLKRKQV